jgi:hypothetical protein
MKQPINRFLFSVLLLLEFGCNMGELQPKSPITELGKLPPVTMEGKNVIGCLVNGKAWSALSTNATAYYQSGILQIAGVVDVPFQGIGINITDAHEAILSSGTYSLANPSMHDPIVTVYNTKCVYEGSTNLGQVVGGELTITRFDKSNFIVSGLYEFILVNQACELDTVKVTNGRFDIRYSR